MPITLTPVLDGTGAIDASGNTLATLTQFDTYLSERLNAASVLAMGDEVKRQGLITAMRVLDALPLIGAPYSVTQPHPVWPRVAINPLERGSLRFRIRTGYETLTGATAGIYDRQGRFWSATAIPVSLRNAQCELAIAMLTDDTFNEVSLRRMLLKSNGVEIDNRLRAGHCVPMAREFLRGFLVGGA